MFLFRIVFWLGLAVMLMPTEEHQQARLYATAAASVERIATFCDRNPKACAAGAEFWSTFLKKAEFASRAAVDLISQRGQRPDAAAGSLRPTGAVAAEPRPASAPRNTPAREDLGPHWRAPPARTGA